jgi:ABC-2 type transport system permease protein
VSSKFWLVAQREFVENLRTKAFWIGILLMPVLLVAVVVVPHLLGKAKSVRKYAVIDESGWLLDAMERRAEQPDFARILRELDEHRRALEADDAAESGSEASPKVANAEIAVLAERLTAIGENTTQRLLDSLDAKQREALETTIEQEQQRIASDPARVDAQLNALAELFHQLGAPEGEAIRKQVDEDVLAPALAMRDAIISWWQELPEEEDRDRYLSHAPGGRFERVDPPALEGEDLFAKLNESVQSKELFAYFVIPAEPIESATGAKYVSNNLVEDRLRRWFEGIATDVVREKRFDRESLSPTEAAWLTASFRFDAKKLSETGEETEVDRKSVLRQWAPPVFVYLLWLAIFSIAQMLLTNTIEEKSNRILEVLLSSVSPLELMIGKIAGIAMTGLTVVVSWVASFIVVARFLPLLLGKTGLPLEDIASDPAYLVPFVVYFLLGYLFYAALFVGIGSVCNSIKEATNLQMPVTVILMVPLLAMIPINEDPNGTLAVAMSFFPPFTPFVMMNRAAGPPTSMEYVVTTLLLLLSIAIVMWAAAKVFRVGVLMTGKVPTPSEILRWIKAPVGQEPVRKD